MTHRTSEIRTAFLDYFAASGHEIVASSPLVPHNDPTLLFTNAGMVQFKNVFTGIENRSYNRAVTSQKCVRAGGKHNDLENVGYTARHHTFFEMLGNFSFGDYFKDVAIELAWDLVTREFGLAPERLLVTVYAEDNQAFDLWKKIAGLPEQRIIRIGTSDNFWSMGETGPCGPCSEIFYDHGEGIPGGPPGSPDEDGDRFIEIWNLVFMQFEQVDAETRNDLPRPSIDTGMGLERVAAVLQGKHDNYDIDLMQALISASASVSGVAPDGEHAVGHRVIADHLRASCFLIADGVLPSNEGRGYVLRRIMRRAMRHGHMMGCEEPVLWKLVPTLVGEMGKAFPELERAQALISETLKLEEGRFSDMLARGLRILADESGKLPDGGVLPGDVAFRLYDTYGFPVDLTQDVLRGKGMTVDAAGFEAAMERQRAEARKHWSGTGAMADEAQWFELRERSGATEFLGYSTETAEGVVVGLIIDGAEAQTAGQGTAIALVANQTPFYAESGGQVGDRGRIIADEFEIEVDDTLRRADDLHVHLGTVVRGEVACGLAARFEVDGARRAGLRAHHSATHLLHEALRRQLGDHVTQKGSLVAPDRLRFDISHPTAIGPENLVAIEREVNARIRLNTSVETRLMTPDQAVEDGAMALFGEKYGTEVRVVGMGADSGRYSVELCGGTHVGRTGDIGYFHIIDESAVGAGVRRIEAVAGVAADDRILQQDAVLGRAAALLRTGRQDLPARIDALLDERKQLERELVDLRRTIATGGAGTGNGVESKDDDVREVAGIKFAPRQLADVPPRELKPMADEIKKKIGSGVAALVSVTDGRASLVVGVTDDVAERISAVDLVRAGSAVLGGKGGGGRPDMAQSGGPEGSAAAAALEAIAAAIAEKTG